VAEKGRKGVEGVPIKKKTREGAGPSPKHAGGWGKSEEGETVERKRGWGKFESLGKPKLRGQRTVIPQTTMTNEIKETPREGEGTSRHRTRKGW